MNPAQSFDLLEGKCNTGRGPRADHGLAGVMTTSPFRGLPDGIIWLVSLQAMATVTGMYH